MSLKKNSVLLSIGTESPRARITCHGWNSNKEYRLIISDDNGGKSARIKLFGLDNNKEECYWHALALHSSCEEDDIHFGLIREIYADDFSEYNYEQCK